MGAASASGMCCYLWTSLLCCCGQVGWKSTKVKHLVFCESKVSSWPSPAVGSSWDKALGSRRCWGRGVHSGAGDQARGLQGERQ